MITTLLPLRRWRARSPKPKYLFLVSQFFQNLLHQIQSRRAHAAREFFDVVFALFHLREGGSEARHVTAGLSHLDGHVRQRFQRLDVSVPAGGDHGGQPGRGVFRIGRGIEVGQGFGILQPAQYRLGDGVILLVESQQQAVVALTGEDAPDGPDELSPAVFLRKLQQLLELRHEIAVVAGAHHRVDQARVREQDLLGLFRHGGHGAYPSGFDGPVKYTTLAPVE
jgi:hypothetical protein